MELRNAFMLITNILKSFISEEESWDPFGVSKRLIKFWFLLVIFFLLSFYSKISLNNLQIQLRFHAFSPVMFVSLFLSLVLPQRACWLYFLVVWLSNYGSFNALIKGFISCSETALSKIHGRNAGVHRVGVEVEVELLDLESGSSREIMETS